MLAYLHSTHFQPCQGAVSLQPLKVAGQRNQHPGLCHTHLQLLQAVRHGGDPLLKDGADIVPAASTATGILGVSDVL